MDRTTAYIGGYGVSHTNLKRMTGSYRDRMIKAFLNSAKAKKM